MSYFNHEFKLIPNCDSYQISPKQSTTIHILTDQEKKKNVLLKIQSK